MPMGNINPQLGRIIGGQYLLIKKKMERNGHGQLQAMSSLGLRG